MNLRINFKVSFEPEIYIFEYKILLNLPYFKVFYLINNLVFLLFIIGFGLFLFYLLW